MGLDLSEFEEQINVTSYPSERQNDTDFILFIENMTYHTTI